MGLSSDRTELPSSSLWYCFVLWYSTDAVSEPDLSNLRLPSHVYTLYFRVPANSEHHTITEDILVQKGLSPRGGRISMAYQITLSDQEYAALATAAAKSGTKPEQLLHDMIQRLQ